MPNLSPEMTYSKATSKPEPELSLDWKTSESVNNLINAIAEIIAHEYVETAKSNPEVFKDTPPFKHSPSPIETVEAGADSQALIPELLVQDKNTIPEPLASLGYRACPTLSLPLSKKGGEYMGKKAI